MARLAIVWRNHEKVQNRVRCLPQARTSGRSIYTVQQLLSVERNLWVNSAVFEVICHPRAVRAVAKPTRRGALGLAGEAGWPESLPPLFVG